MNDRERERLLDRVHQPSNSIGKSIPERLEVAETTIDLKEFVFECKRLDAVPEERREEIADVKRTLERERLQRKQQIADGDVSAETGEELVRSIHGVDRALNALEGLESPSIGEELREKKLEDARELLSLAEISP